MIDATARRALYAAQYRLISSRTLLAKVRLFASGK